MTATTNFESSTISLPLPVPAHGGRDAEEGEISDGLEEGEEVFSDISDEDFESNYGRSGMKKDFKEDKITLVRKRGHMGSIVEKSTENDLVDDFEDVDEDILYLRLMALRSMIPSSDTPASNKYPISSQSIEDEMEELLEEADKAAAQSSIPPPPIIDIADSDEEKMDLYIKTMTTNMSFLAPIKVKEEIQEPHNSGGPLDEPNLQYLVMKLKRSLENGSSNTEKEGSVYSPTQSPLHMSPPSSPDVIPLPPERVLKPPGDDEYIENKVAISGHQPVDMELGSENEAEIQFFKHQKEIPSVIGWPQHHHGQLLGSGAMSAPSLPPQMLYNCDHYLYQERMYQEQLNSISGNKNDLIKAVTAKPPPPPPLIPTTTPTTSKAKKRIRKRKSTVKFISTSDEEENAQAVQTKRRITPPPPVVPIDPIDSDDEEAMRAHLLSTMAAKRSARKEVDIINKVPKQVEKAKSEKPTLKKPSKPIKKSLSKVCCDATLLMTSSTDMPFDKLKKYFPNMVRPFIIPLNIPASSEDESTSTKLFQANLDLFMKNAREDSCSVPRLKRIPPPKPIRKNPPRSKGATSLLLNNKTNPIRKRYISMIEKESLKTRSSIEHLPIERQKEYKMLLARIAVKEKKQQLENSKKDAEDPEEMRKLLLSKMKNLKSKIDQNKIDLKKKVLVESKENNEPKNVGGEESTVPEKQVDERVVCSEKDLIQSRTEVVNELFKLSAQLSQFKNESEKLITARNFLSDLQKQVEETRKLIKKKEERITQLRNVVKLSHHSITKKRKDLSAQESQCKKLGETLIGTSYELPNTGSEQIKQKLVQITSNAKLCKKANLESARIGGVASSTKDDPEASLGSGSGNGDCPSPQKKNEISGVSSSIAHLKSGDNSIDPHQEFCRFELLGKCNDDACPYQHHKSVS